MSITLRGIGILMFESRPSKRGKILSKVSMPTTQTTPVISL